MLLDKNYQYVSDFTVNTDMILKENIVLLKNYSENEGIVEILVEKGIVRLTNNKYQSGFVELIEAEILNIEDYNIDFEG